jgi:two-component system chemotaxis response regulator CheB
MIVIGASLGGMMTLRRVLKPLPATFPIPIAAALHRHKDSNNALVSLIQLATPLEVREVVDKEPIRPAHIYLAPPDYHLLVEKDCFNLSVDEQVQYARPSIDVFFESAADAFGPALIALVLTGANTDGARGAARIKACGGIVAVEDPATAESPVMPEAARVAAQPDFVLPADGLGALLIELAAQRFTQAPSP